MTFEEVMNGLFETGVDNDHICKVIKFSSDNGIAAFELSVASALFGALTGEFTEEMMIGVLGENVTDEYKERVHRFFEFVNDAE